MIQKTSPLTLIDSFSIYSFSREHSRLKNPEQSLKAEIFFQKYSNLILVTGNRQYNRLVLVFDTHTHLLSLQTEGKHKIYRAISLQILASTSMHSFLPLHTVQYLSTKHLKRADILSVICEKTLFLLIELQGLFKGTERCQAVFIFILCIFFLFFLQSVNNLSRSSLDLPHSSLGQLL